MSLNNSSMGFFGGLLITTGNMPKWRRFVLVGAGVLGLFAGLCTLFALVVTAGEAWVEHAQAQWPRSLAQIQRCGLDIYVHRPESYWIDCSVSYTVRGQDMVAHVHSRSVPSPQRTVWEYPAGRFEQMQEWVDEHPEGTTIAVHYDPAHRGKAVLVDTDMPLGGPRTPDNLKLLGFCAVSCAVLLAIGRIARPRNDTTA